MYGYISFAKASLGLLIGSLLYFYFGLNGPFSGIVLSAFVAHFYILTGSAYLVILDKVISSDFAVKSFFVMIIL